MLYERADLFNPLGLVEFGTRAYRELDPGVVCVACSAQNLPMAMAVCFASSGSDARRWIVIRNDRKNYGTQKQIEGAYKPEDSVALFTTEGEDEEELGITLKNAGLDVVQLLRLKESGTSQGEPAAGPARDVL
jgi:orotate phosphoribosyltransferase